MTEEIREILLDALAKVWMDELFENVDEYMDAVRQVKDLK